MRGWRVDKLRRFPELHFTYEEEASPEDFFVPYVWTQVSVFTPILLTWALLTYILCCPFKPTVSGLSGLVSGSIIFCSHQQVPGHRPKAVILCRAMRHPVQDG